MGKLNVAKMANFMEVDCYVLVACPENSLIDSKVNIPLSLSCSCFFTHIIFHVVPFGPFFLPIPLLLFSLDQGALFYLSWLLTCMCAGVLPPNCHPFWTGTCSCQVHENDFVSPMYRSFCSYMLYLCGRQRALDPRSGLAIILLTFQGFYRTCVPMALRMKMRQVMTHVHYSIWIHDRLTYLLLH